MLRSALKKMIPQAFLASLRNFRILSVGYGQYRSIRDWDSVDSAGNPIPWYTYPATEYITQLDLSDKAVFEYGSGNSTRFWAERCKQLVSVEDNPVWFDKVKGDFPSHVDYQLHENQQKYVESINSFPEMFDVIIIDGSHRFECAREGLKKLSDTGFVILDNADWKDRTSALLRDADLIEVDMAGFGPINDYTWTTSFYFRRSVSLSPAHQRQPVHGVGSVKHTET